MRIIICIVIVSVLSSFNEQPLSEVVKQINAVEVLEKTSKKLNSFKEISYSYYRSINYFSEDYHSESKGTTLLYFDKSDTLLGFKFQLEDSQSKIIYNGTERFSLNKKDKTIKIDHTPKREGFESLSFLLNSIITLKNSLPTIITDKNIQKTLSDTIINDRAYYLVSFILENKTLSGLGSFSPITLKRNFLYKVVIDKNDFLPLQIIQTNNAEPKDYMLTSFGDIKSEENLPSELSWYYSTYADYKSEINKRLSLIKENSVAPVFKLPYYNTDDSVSPIRLKNKFVLLEFWIKNCGYCIQAVPKLNKIVEKYKSKNLEVIGINASDSKEHIGKFYEKNKPLFRTVYDENGKITTSFGVDSFPQIVLIDKRGKVLYAGDFDGEQIEKLLDKEF